MLDWNGNNNDYCLDTGREINLVGYKRTCGKMHDEIFYLQKR